MTTKTYAINIADRERLEALLREAESTVDSLSDEDLDEAEAQVSLSVRSLLSQKSSVPTLVFDQSASRVRSLSMGRLYSGGFAFLAAAAALFMVRPWSQSSLESPYVGSKGSVAAELSCEVSWMQSDRSTPPSGDNGQIILQPDLPTYMKIACILPRDLNPPPQLPYVHVSIEKDGERIWLLRNTVVSADGEWLENKGELVDFRPALGYRAQVLVTKEPVDGQDLDATKVLWQDKVLFKSL